MTSCKTIVMTRGAVRLTAVCAGNRDAAQQKEDRERELARTRAETAERKLREAEQMRCKQQELCQRCGNRIEAFMRGLQQEVETKVVEMGLKLAEVVLRHQLPDRAMLAALIHETLQPIADLRGARIRVSPAEARAGILRDVNGFGPAFAEQVELTADPGLAAGDLVIETRNGIFDARLKERLALLSEKLEERLKHANATPASPAP